MSDPPTHSVVSLFAGCGGIDLGFKGGFKYTDKTFPFLPFDVVWANDWDQSAVHVYNHNHSTNFEPEDIRTLDFSSLIGNRRGVEVVTAGFPCQGLFFGPDQGMEPRHSAGDSTQRFDEHFAA